MPHSGEPTPLQTYQQRAEIFDRQRHDAEIRAYWVSWGRVVSFLAAALCFYLGWPTGGWSFEEFAWSDFIGPGFIGAGLLLILFLFLVSWSTKLRQQEDRLAGLSRINRHALARLKRQWNQFPTAKVDLPAKAEVLSHDLDLFGHASLYQLVCTAHTSLGRLRLRDWLLEPASPGTISQRQAAVSQLAPELELRQEMEYLGLRAAQGHADVSRFVGWAESEPWLNSHRWLVGLSRVLPIGALTFFAMGIFNLIPASLWVLPVILSMVISFIYCRKIHTFFDHVSSRRDEIRSYSNLFSQANLLPKTGSILQRLMENFPAGPNAPHHRLARLGRIMDLANFRYSPMVYMVVQPLTMWDFHVLWLVERWQRQTGGQVRAWFTALSELEALNSLASLAHDHPQWSMPQVDTPDGKLKTLSLHAMGLGHPLLPESIRVANDVTIGPSGTVLLVTGSNMSGKSTLLRALGTNVALAQAGGPVCAAQLTLPPVLLATSMRIDDSLEQGVSFFMAELKRLKEIVDLAVLYGTVQHNTVQQDSMNDSNAPARLVLYLLDEILLGTNSTERHIAVERVLGHLLHQGAIGAITTHDLELASSSLLKEACQSVHFRETFITEEGQQQMQFDYQLHSGIATTRNALKLLEMVGLAETETTVENG
ncbi:MAG: hypothetical protein ABGX16_02315 [Pirellulales bacterium]